MKSNTRKIWITTIIGSLSILTSCQTITDPVTGKKTTTLTPAAKAVMDATFTAVETTAIATAESTALNTSEQLISTGKVNTKTLEQNALQASLSSGAATIRTLQTTAAAASGTATVSALLAGSTSPAATAISSPVTLPSGTTTTLTATVKGAVSAQIAAGVPPDLANENVANALDSAASPNASSLVIATL